MSGGQIDISFSGDEKDLVKAQARVIKQQDELIQKMRRMKRDGTEAAQSNTRELEKFAAATKRIDAKPADKYRDTMTKLAAATRAGLLTQEEYARAVSRVNAEQRQAFGANSAQQVVAFATVLSGAGGVLSRMVGHLKAMREERDKLGQQQREAEGGLAELAQLATSPRDMNRLVGLAKQTFREGGAPSLDAAARLVFSLQSAGSLDQRELFSQLGSSKLAADPAEFAKAAATMVESMGMQETGGTRAIVSKAFGASQFSPARAEELLISTAQSGIFGKMLGLSDEELLAATAIAATGTGSASEGGTAVTSLLKSLVDKGDFKGLTLRQSVEKIQASGMDDAQLIEFFGRAEAAKAFGLLSGNMGNFERNVQAIRQSEATDEVGRRLKLADAVPELRAARLLREKEAGAQLAGDKQATINTLADALMSDLIEDMRRRGVGEIRKYIKTKIMDFERSTSGDEAFITRFQQFSPDRGKFRTMADDFGLDLTGRRNQITGELGFTPIGQQLTERHAQRLEEQRAAIARQEAAAEKQAAAADRLVAAAESLDRAAANQAKRPAVVTRVRPVANPVEQ